MNHLTHATFFKGNPTNFEGEEYVMDSAQNRYEIMAVSEGWFTLLHDGMFQKAGVPSSCSKQLLTSELTRQDCTRFGTPRNPEPPEPEILWNSPAESASARF